MYIILLVSSRSVLTFFCCFSSQSAVLRHYCSDGEQKQRSVITYIRSVFTKLKNYWTKLSRCLKCVRLEKDTNVTLRVHSEASRQAGGNLTSPTSAQINCITLFQVALKHLVSFSNLTHMKHLESFVQSFFIFVNTERMYVITERCFCSPSPQ